MSTIPHQPVAEPVHRRIVLGPTEMWASLAIVVIWLAVLFAAIYGPDVVTSSSGGSDSATIPSAVVMALFACIATWPVAKYGFEHDRPTDA